VLRDWFQGKKTPWPPRPEVRFNVGERVECRVGPHPVKGAFISSVSVVECAYLWLCRLGPRQSC
jgi:hypothetical protein